VIDRVHVLARRSNANRDLTFAWRDGTTIIDEEDEGDDSDYKPEDTEYDSESDSDSDFVPDGDDDEEDAGDDDRIVDDVDLPLGEVEDNEQDNPEEIAEDNEQDNQEVIAEDNEEPDEESIYDDDKPEESTHQSNTITGVTKEEENDETIEEDMNNH
jgi:hypothetical protein